MLPCANHKYQFASALKDVYEAILVTIVAVTLGVYLVKKIRDESEARQIAITADEDDTDEGIGQGIELGKHRENLWREIVVYDNGIMVGFEETLGSEICIYCAGKLLQPDPYTNDKKGWVCTRCNTPHHLECYKEVRKCQGCG